MSEKEIITNVSENSVQYTIRLKEYKNKQTIKIKSPFYSCVNSFIVLSENYLNIELKLPDLNKLEKLNTIAKACTNPYSTKVYQKMFKHQIVKKDSELHFIFSKVNKDKKTYSVDLSFILQMIRPRHDDDFPKAR